MQERSTVQKMGVVGKEQPEHSALTRVLAGLPVSFERALLAQNKSKTTVVSYMGSLHSFYSFLCEQGMPIGIEAIGREHIETWLSHIMNSPNSRTGKPVEASTAAKHYKVLKVYFGWAVDEGELRRNPMEKMKRPQIPENPPPVLSAGEILSLLKVCEGKDFYARRDTAIVRLLLDTGIRVSELVGMSPADIDWSHNAITVLGKGRRIRSVPFGRKSSQVLDRYQRSRTSYPSAQGDEKHFWVGHSGPLTTSGVLQILRDRGDKAGIESMHPHLLRHAAAHNWLSEGGTENGLMRIMGWRSRTMVGRYAASAATQRAHEEHGRLQIGDKF